jgi:hypothetical protein
MRWGLLAILIGTMVAWSGARAVPFGLLRGVVTLEDGTPYAGATVTYIAGGEPVTEETGTNGTFGAMVPAGPVTATLTDPVEASATGTVVAGEVCTLTVVVKLPGVLLSVLLPSGRPVVYAAISAAYASPDGPGNGIPGVRVAPGRFWLSGIPASATHLAVIARVAGGTAPQVTRKEFTLPTRDVRRRLSLEMPSLTPVRFTVVDVTGVTLPRVKVSGKVIYFTPAYDSWYPEGKDPDAEALAAGRRTPLELTRTMANAHGVVNLGEWPAGRYIAKLVVGDQVQPDLPFTISKAGASLTRVQLTGPYRRVTQTVFDAQGKPVPRAEVFASYCWLGKAVLAHNTADADGLVTWEHLPPARAIVWGPQVPAVVLPADADEVTEPLPSPVPDVAAPVRFSLLNPGDGRVHFSWLLWKSDRPGNPDESQEQDYVPLTYAQQMAGAPDPAYFECPLQGGVPFHLLVVAQTHPLWMTALTSVYAPYNDAIEPPVFDLALVEGAFLHGRFTTPAGKPALVTHLRVDPTGPQALPPVVKDDLARQLGHLAVTQDRDGAYTADFLCAGAYRFTADLFDTGVPPPPGMAVTVAQGENVADVTLSEPLVTAPGGVTLRWVTRAAPFTERRLTLPASPTPLPLYGPKEGILATWYATTPTALTVAAAGQPPRTLTLRKVTVQPRDAAGAPVTDAVHLLPLLPMPSDTRFFYQLPGEGHPETTNTLLRKDGTYDAFLYPGAYPLVDDTLQGRLGLLTVPEAGAPLPVTVRAEAAATKAVTLKFPAERPRNGARMIGLRCDVPLPEPALVHPDDLAHGVTLQLPAAARTLSLQWLGAGVIDGVALPAGNGTVTLPAWSPGATITGTVTDAEGAPAADITLVIGARHSLSDDNVTRTTDAAGRFSVSGVLPGPCFAYLRGDLPDAGWSFPVVGNTTITLRQAEAPVTFALPEELGNAQRVWWLPDGGKPLPVPSTGRRGGNTDNGADTWRQCTSHDVIPGPGWLWATDGRHGRSVYLPVNAQPNWNHLEKRAAPTLALYAPLDAGCGAVTLVGDGPRAGLTAAFPACFWQPLPLLNTTAAQIDAVPPGPYKVTVETKTGRVTLPVTVTEYGAVATVR